MSTLQAMVLNKLSLHAQTRHTVFCFKRFIRRVRKAAAKSNASECVTPINNARSMLDQATTYMDLQSPAMIEDSWSTELYPKNVGHSHDVTKYSYRPPELRPQDTSIILFSGQGSQYVGMIKDLIKCNEAKKLFDTASHILKYDLIKLCMEGPKEELDKTIYSQPAVFVTDLAALELLKQEKPKVVENCIATAGFSVGEFAALVFAGALSFRDALKLVKMRADASQKVAESVSTGLMTVFENHHSQLAKALTAARQFVNAKRGNPEFSPVCTIAYYLFSQCKVVGGEEEALQFLEDNADKYGLKCKRVPASGAFHTYFMREVAETMKMELKRIKVSLPLINVHSNLEGKAYSKRNTSDLARKLVRHVYSPVRWEQTMHILYDRDFFDESFPQTFECGPSSTLGTLLRRTHAKAYRNYRHVLRDFTQMESVEAVQS